MTEWQKFCLAQMGIQRWERRSIPFHLGIVLHEPLCEATKRLLSAILTAFSNMKMQVSLLDAIPEKTDYSALWVMTDRTAEINIPCVTSLPLSRLLEDPLQKRALFFALYRLMNSRA